MKNPGKNERRKSIKNQLHTIFVDKEEMSTPEISQKSGTISA